MEGEKKSKFYKNNVVNSYFKDSQFYKEKVIPFNNKILHLDFKLFQIEIED